MRTAARSYEIADGATFNFWTFGGTVPGPMIRVRRGDYVVTLDCDLTYATDHINKLLEALVVHHAHVAVAPEARGDATKRKSSPSSGRMH